MQQENNNKYANAVFTANNSISIPGDLFNSIIELVRTAISEGQKVNYFSQPSKEVFESQVPQVSLTPTAFLAVLIEDKIRTIGKQIS